MRVIERPSPNFGSRRAGAAIDMLVLHYTGMKTAEEALQRLCDPRAEVSVHWLIDEEGLVYRLVDERQRAWHAGVSCWAGERDVNSRSIGIELANPGHEFGYRDFPKPQMDVLIELARGVLSRHPIPPHRVLGHSDVAPTRKLDPGEKFDWRTLAGAGVGLWPGPVEVANATPAVAPVQGELAAFGYEIAVTNKIDPQTAAVVTAFQRHFRPARADGAIDAETAAMAAALTRLAPALT